MTWMVPCGRWMRLVWMAVLSNSQWNPAGAEVCRLVNEGLAAFLVKHGDRYKALAAIPVADTKAAVAEIDHAIGKLNLSGLGLVTSQGQELTASSKAHLWPIYAKAVEYDVPIFWHPDLMP